MFLNVLNLYAQNDINKLFFNLPLESNRDSIYSAIEKFGFIKEKPNHIVSQNDKIVKTFYGYLDNKSSDSTKIQLATRSSFIENEKYYQNLLIVLTYHHFSNIKIAKKTYQKRKREIEKIISEKSSHFKNFEENTEIGFSDIFNDSKTDTYISIEFKKKEQEYIIILEYKRNEGEKKLKRQFIKKKELVYRKINRAELYQSYNVQRVPVTKRCKSKNTKSIECLKKDISRQISRDLAFEDYNLIAGIHKIHLNFIVDKNGEIINIKVLHENNKLCQEIKESINEINIIEPATNNGIKVDFIITVPLIISIE